MSDDTPSLTITALVRRATDADGNGPSAGAIRRYIAAGLLPVTKAGAGQYLFKPSDASLALRIYKSRQVRQGKARPSHLESHTA